MKASRPSDIGSMDNKMVIRYEPLKVERSRISGDYDAQRSEAGL